MGEMKYFPLFTKLFTNYKKTTIMKTIQLAEISEKIFEKFGLDKGLSMICSLSAAELVKMI